MAGELAFYRFFPCSNVGFIHGRGYEEGARGYFATVR
jgi:hypothetical protein